MLELKYSKVVESEYEKIGIDIEKEDAQFYKYSLVSLNENIQIFNGKDSQTIRDERIGKHFWINVPRKLLASIEELIEKGMLFEIAFRIDYVSEYVPTMEEMEFGAPLRLKISSLPKLSKFYSTGKYENNLWIPLRQNSCRAHRTWNPGALMEEQVGKVRTSIQGQGCSPVAAA